MATEGFAAMGLACVRTLFNVRRQDAAYTWSLGATADIVFSA